MNWIYGFIVFGYLLSLSLGDIPKSKVVRCAVCRSLVEEIQNSIEEVDPNKTVQVGSFRLDADGQQKKSTRKYAGSEIHMTELMESICSKFDDYAQAHHKETNKFEVIKLIVNGKMNPNFQDYEMVQDPDLNKGLQYHCESIIEDFEDEIVGYFTKLEKKPVNMADDFCSGKTHLCSSRDEL